VTAADGLKAISRYLSTLEFADRPDHDRLRADLSSMPDIYPAMKFPQANGQSSLTSSYAPTPAASPSLAHSGPIPGMQYPAAHPSNGSAPVQYPEAAWAPAQGTHQYSHEPEALQSEAAWQGYGPNGYARNSSSTYAQDDRNGWESAQQQWCPNVQVSLLKHCHVR